MASSEQTTRIQKDKSITTTGDFPLFVTGTVFVSLNLILMLFVGFYWISPSFHQFLTGNPL